MVPANEHVVVNESIDHLPWYAFLVGIKVNLSHQADISSNNTNVDVSLRAMHTFSEQGSFWVITIWTVVALVLIFLLLFIWILFIVKHHKQHRYHKRLQRKYIQHVAQAKTKKQINSKKKVSPSKKLKK
ncbi:MAG: hypothetical protein GXP45_05240 [bacterium]|nr:hypothetical protein [bacterium]